MYQSLTSCVSLLYGGVCVYVNRYTSGVITSSTCGTALDHGVLVVGYDHDKTSGLDYWIVKNSWGASWGQSGYVWLARGQNTCGINQQPSYPVA